ACKQGGNDKGQEPTHTFLELNPCLYIQKRASPYARLMGKSSAIVDQVNAFRTGGDSRPNLVTAVQSDFHKPR
ncbi:MAG: hypothetical protein ABW131_16450, partial [Candidatus Sedimenticola sp. 6PFRAG5]